jgi:hypothetical protein
MRTEKEVEYYYNLLKEASSRAIIPEYFEGHFDILLWVLDNDEYNKSDIKKKMEDVIGSFE